MLVVATSSARGEFAGYKEGANPTVIYVASGESTNGRIRRSIDGGATWSGALSTGSTSGTGFCGGQCFYNIGFDVRPGATIATTDDIVVLGGNVPGSGTTPSRLFAKSTNGGVTFTETSDGLHAIRTSSKSTRYPIALSGTGMMVVSSSPPMAGIIGPL